MAQARFLLFSRRVGARPGVSWRLVAPNNREIARAAAIFATVDDCGAELQAVRCWADVAASRLVREPASTVTQAGWRWQLDVGVRPVAVSSRSYQRRLECEVALAQFRSLAPTARAEMVLKPRA